MEISSIPSQNLSSIRQALAMANLNTAMNRDGETMDGLLEGMEEQSQEIQAIAQSHKGRVVDILV